MISWSTSSKGLPIFQLPWSSLNWPSWVDICWKYLEENAFLVSLSGEKDLKNRNKEQRAKQYKPEERGKSGEWNTVVESFEKLPQNSWDSERAGHMLREDLKNLLSSHLWLTFRLSISRKWKWRQSFKLFGWMLKVSPSTHTHSLPGDLYFFFRYLRKSIKPLTDQ